jgi:hypothetical protein
LAWEFTDPRDRNEEFKQQRKEKGRGREMRKTFLEKEKKKERKCFWILKEKRLWNLIYI